MPATYAWGRAGALVMAILLQACSGGSDSETPPTPVPDSLTLSTAGTGEAGVAQAFTSSANAAAGLRFEWSFGDGTGSSAAAPTHTYASTGDFDVSLRVSNSAGQARTASSRVSVNRVAHLQGLECSAPNQSGWCWIAPSRSGQPIAATSFADENNGWAVGAFGQILRTRDGGRTWTPQRSGVGRALTEVRARSASEVYALGPGVLLRSVDGGTTWDPKPVPINSNSLDTFAPAGLSFSFYSGPSPSTSSRVIGFSNDRGANFTYRSLQTARAAPGGTLWALNLSSPRTTSLGTAPLYRSTDGGRSFDSVVNMPAPPVTTFRREASALVVFDDLSVLVQWEPDPDPDPARRGRISMLTRDGGQTWSTFTAQPFTGDAFAAAITGYDATGWMIAGSSSAPTCRVSSDYGRTWAAFNVPGGGCAVGIAGLLVGNTAISGDRGATWSPYNPPTGTSSFPLQRIGPSTLVLGRWISRDFGVSWTEMLAPATASAVTPTAFAAVTPTRLVRTGYFDGSAQSIQLSVDGGRSWATALPAGSLTGSGPIGGAPVIQFVSAQVGYVSWGGLTDARLLRSSDGGATWALLPATAGAAEFIDDRTGFAIVGGDLKVTRDGGTRWAVPTVAGAGPPPAEQACGSAQLVAGGTPGRINFVRFVDATRGVVVTSNGRIWTTADGGVTCVRRPDVPVPASVAKAADGSLWLLDTEGRLHRSDDQGASWQGIAVNAPVPSDDYQPAFRWTALYFSDANQGWLAGPQGLVAYTRDRGRTWSTQRNGRWGNAQQIQFVDSRTGWMLGDDSVFIGTGTGGQ